MTPILEKSRAEVELSVILEYYESLNSLFTSLNVLTAFVFNVYESGFIDYIDMNEKIAIVPFNAPPGTVKSGERSSKRSTMIGAISIDGTKLKPYIVLTNKTCEKELIINGYRDSNVLKVYQKMVLLHQNHLDTGLIQLFSLNYEKKARNWIQKYSCFTPRWLLSSLF